MQRSLLCVAADVTHYAPGNCNRRCGISSKYHANLSGHIDLVQFSVPRTNSGWTKRPQEGVWPSCWRWWHLCGFGGLLQTSPKMARNGRNSAAKRSGELALVDATDASLSEGEMRAVGRPPRFRAL
jgi:hypothetical protein